MVGGFRTQYCNCCAPNVSRRQFLCTAAAGAAAVSSIATGLTGSATPADARPRRNSDAAGRPLLLKGGIVLTMDRTVGDFENADVLIEGKKISAIRPGISAPTAEVIDASNMIVMPGFIDTHRHMWEGFLRNIQPDASLLDYRGLIQRAFGSVMTPDDVYAGDLLSALGCIDAGITTVLDWSHIQNSPEHTDAAIKGLADSGVRGVFAYGNNQNLTGEWWKETKQKFPGDIARLRKQYFSSADQLLTLFMAAPSTITVQPAGLERIADACNAARDVGAPITLHVGVAQGGRIGLLELLNDMKILRGDITYVHCNELNDNEWKTIRDTGATVSMATYVESMMGHGNTPVQKALDMGIKPSLSVDVETSVPNDFFTQIRTLFALQRNQIWSRQIDGDKNTPKLLTGRDVLEFATVEGARANNLLQKTGTLTPGKEADVIMLRTDMLNVMPVNNALGAVLSSMGPQNVDTVLIAGKIMKRNGRMLGVDMSRISRLVNAARERTHRAAKIPTKRV